MCGLLILYAMATPATFEDYLREMRIIDAFEGMSNDVKGNIVVAYTEWFKLKNQSLAPGNSRLRWHLVLHCILPYPSSN